MARKRKTKPQPPALMTFTGEYPEGIARVNAGAKWVLDLARNMLVVGLLSYLARKTNDELLRILHVVVLCALFAYLVSYTARVRFHFAERFRWNARGFWVERRVNDIVYGLLAGGPVASIEYLTARLSEAQFGP